MPRPVYIANWKMFHSLETADQWMEWWLGHPLEGFPAEALIVVCPPAPLIYPLYGQIRQQVELTLGGQDFHASFKGAFTGDTSGVALWSVGAQWVLIGHSERRRLHQESDAVIGDKVEQAFLCGLCPVICVGETSEERDAGETVEVLERQLSGAFAKITEETLLHRQHDPTWPPLVIAYEPVWAIGSGRPASPELADEILTIIRHWVAARYPAEYSDHISLLYGGSVTPENVGRFTGLPNCNGVLVGGASLEASGFQRILMAGLLGQGYAVTNAPLVSTATEEL